jgi:hypothetical protein
LAMWSRVAIKLQAAATGVSTHPAQMAHAIIPSVNTNVGT